jgi:hypothetical protein
LWHEYGRVNYQAKKTCGSQKVSSQNSADRNIDINQKSQISRDSLKTYASDKSLAPSCQGALKTVRSHSISEQKKSALINFSDVVTEDYELQRG